MRTNYYKIVKQLKSFKTIKLLQHVSVYTHNHQGALSLCFAKVTMLTSVTYISLFEVIIIVAAYAATIMITIKKHCFSFWNL